MTKSIKYELLNHLYYLKSIGYKYVDGLNLANNEEDYSKLPNNLDILKNNANHCYLCDLSKIRKNVVFGQGNPNANLMFISTIPENSENELGKFFVGRSGELLARMIENVLLIKKEDIYITNIVKCRPLDNKMPKQNEYEACKPYLFKQLELVNPKVIVTLGESAYGFLTNENVDINKVRGESMKFLDKILIPTFSPSFLLRNPSLKKEAYFDMLKIKNLMESIN